MHSHGRLLVTFVIMCKTAKLPLVVFNCGKVVDLFACPPGDFCTFRNLLQYRLTCRKETFKSLLIIFMVRSYKKILCWCRQPLPETDSVSYKSKLQQKSLCKIAAAACRTRHDSGEFIFQQDCPLRTGHDSFLSLIFHQVAWRSFRGVVRFLIITLLQISY